MYGEKIVSVEKLILDKLGVVPQYDDKYRIVGITDLNGKPLPLIEIDTNKNMPARGFALPEGSGIKIVSYADGHIEIKCEQKETITKERISNTELSGTQDNSNQRISLVKELTTEEKITDADIVRVRADDDKLAFGISYDDFHTFDILFVPSIEEKSPIISIHDGYIINIKYVDGELQFERYGKVVESINLENCTSEKLKSTIINYIRSIVKGVYWTQRTAVALSIIDSAFDYCINIFLSDLKEYTKRNSGENSKK